MASSGGEIRFLADPGSFLGRAMYSAADALQNAHHMINYMSVADV